MLLILGRFAFADDSRLKPSRVFHIDFPELGPSEHAELARMGIYLPLDYNLDRSYPLFVWFGGGPGGDNPGPARQIAGDSGFVCVGLPYKKNLVWKTPWSFYETMLRELERTVPNIDPRRRACSGFSSGGAAICFSMVQEDSGFRDYFHALMPGGAGWVMGDLAPLKGKPVYAFIGAKDSRTPEFSKIEPAAKKAGADITYFEYNAGHVMPTAHFPEMRKWLVAKVLLRDLPQMRRELQEAISAGQAGKAFRAARGITEITAEDAPEYQEARAAIERVLPIGEKLADKALTAPLAEQQRFVLEWKGCDFAAPVAVKCEETAATQLATILGRDPVSPVFLKKYISMWESFPAAAEALPHYEKFASEALGKIGELPTASAKNQALQRYISNWDPAPSVKKAREIREEIAREEFKSITSIQSKGSMKAKLRDFIRAYEGTDVEREARKLLDE